MVGGDVVGLNVGDAVFEVVLVTGDEVGRLVGIGVVGMGVTVTVTAALPVLAFVAIGDGTGGPDDGTRESDGIGVKGDGVTSVEVIVDVTSLSDDGVRGSSVVFVEFNTSN